MWVSVFWVFGVGVGGFGLCGDWLGIVGYPGGCFSLVG